MYAGRLYCHDKSLLPMGKLLVHWQGKYSGHGELTLPSGETWGAESGWGSKLETLPEPQETTFFFFCIVCFDMFFDFVEPQVPTDCWWCWCLTAKHISQRTPGHLLWNKLNFVPITSDPNCATTSPPCQVCGRLPNAQVSWPGVTPKSQEGVRHGVRQWIFAEGSIVARTSVTLETEPLQRRTICRWQRPHESWYEFIRILANSYHKCSPYDFLVYDVILIWVWGMQHQQSRDFFRACAHHRAQDLEFPGIRKRTGGCPKKIISFACGNLHS